MPMSLRSQKLQERFLAGISQVEDRAQAVFQTRLSQYNENISIPEFFPHGPQDTIYEMYKKVLRLESLLMQKNSHEMCMDSVLDILNYAKFTGSLFLLQNSSVERNESK